ncbi:hypothetical protein ACM0P6_11125 [Komagataeibacter sucrofermentans]|nr:hypothetical protein [Komagataeibacter sucrofermentans]
MHRPACPSLPQRLRRLLQGAGACLAVTLLPAPGHAAPAYPAAIMGPQTTAHAWGIETRFAQSTPCRVDMTINQTIFMAHMPEMIQAGLFNTQVTPALQKQIPHYLMNTLQIDVTPGFVHALFTQRGAPAGCHFDWFYIAPDGTRHPMVGFDMTRAADARIDWAHLRFGDMAAATRNPVIDPRFDALVNQETVDVTIALGQNQNAAESELPPPSNAGKPAQ